MCLAPSAVGNIQYDNLGGFYHNFPLSGTHCTPTLGLYKVSQLLPSENVFSVIKFVKIVFIMYI